MQKILFAIVGMFAVTGSATATVIYTYTGQSIDQVSPSNASQLGNHMSLAMEFSSLLPANSLGLSVCPSGCAITVQSFDAHGGGPIVASSSNGGHMLSNAQVSTDANGQIVDWSMTFSFLSAAIVFSSTALPEFDLPLPVFDVGEVQNTHWGASAVGNWTPVPQPVSSPSTMSLLMLGALVAVLARKRKNHGGIFLQETVSLTNS